VKSNRVIAAALIMFIAALAIHAVVWLQYREDPFAHSYISDSLSYHHWAERIASAGLAEEPVFHQSPLFPLLLGTLYRLTSPASRPFVAILLQVLLLSAAIALLVPLGRSYLGSTAAGVAAALLVLLHGPFVFHSMKLLPISLALATQALALLLLALAARNGKPWLALICGASWGIAFIARSETLLFLPLALALLWLGSGNRDGRGWRPAALCLCGALLILAPVTIHNARRGDAVLIASSGGENLFIGNQRGGDGGHLPLHPQAGDLFSQRTLAKSIAEKKLGRELLSSEISDYWRGRAVEEIAADPLAWCRLEMKKLGRILHPGDPADMYSYPLERRLYLPALYMLPVPPLALWLLGAIGAYLALRRSGRCWPLLAFLAVHLAVLMLFFASSRLRLPLLFFIAPFAGLAVVEGFHAWRKGRRLIAACVAALVLLAALHWMFVLEPSPREIVRLASVLSRQEKLDESLAVLESAVAEPEPDPFALDQSGWVLSKKGEWEQARARYQRALERGLSGTRAAQTRSRLAVVHEQLGEIELAEAMHDAAVAGGAANAGAFFERGLFRLRLGARQGAMMDLEQAIAMAPEWPEPRAALRSLELNPAPSP
jgi:tetratricopeptide (TPR) repeat protein